MSRIKTERNNLVIEDIKKGEYLVDIAKKYNVSPSMISKIKRKYLKVVESAPAASGKIKNKKRNK